MKNKLILFLAALAFTISCEDKKATVYDIQFNIEQLDFGRVQTFTAKDSIIIITNSNKSSGTFNGIFEIYDMNNLTFENVKNFTLEKGESVQVLLSFKPKSLDDFKGRFTVIDEDRNTEFFYELSVSGTGVGPIRFSSNTTNLNFGLAKTGIGKNMNLTISNAINSGFDLNIKLAPLNGDFSFTQTTTEYSVSIGTSQEISINYDPTSRTASDSVLITHNSTLEDNPLIILLTGTLDESETIINDLDQGWLNFISGSYAAAVLNFQHPLNIAGSSALYDSLHAELLSGSGWSYAYLREYSEAIDEFNGAKIYFNGTSLETKLDILAGLTIVSLILGDYDDVIEYGTELLSLKPNYTFQYKSSLNYKDIRLAKAQAYFNLGDFGACSSELDLLDPDQTHSSDPAELLQFLQTISAELQ